MGSPSRELTEAVQRLPVRECAQHWSFEWGLGRDWGAIDAIVFAAAAGLPIAFDCVFDIYFAGLIEW